MQVTTVAVKELVHVAVGDSVNVTSTKALAVSVDTPMTK